MKKYTLNWIILIFFPIKITITHASESYYVGSKISLAHYMFSAIWIKVLLIESKSIYLGVAKIRYFFFIGWIIHFIWKCHECPWNMTKLKFVKKAKKRIILATDIRKSLKKDDFSPLTKRKTSRNFTFSLIFWIF